MKQASVKIERLDDFLGRARKLARLADAGKPIPESFVISFEDPADMLAVLTPARLALFRAIKQKPGSIASIAQKMKRDRSAVTRDVAALIALRAATARSNHRISPLEPPSPRVVRLALPTRNAFSPQ
jgi:predicted transcriptional regulator